MILNIDDIKKGCEFAEGFEYHKSLAGTYFLEYNKNDDYRLVLDSIALDSDGDEVLYDHFLTKVVEGINDQFSTMDNKYLYSIKQDYSDIEVYHDYELVTEFSIGVLGINQAKELSIKYIMDQS